MECNAGWLDNSPDRIDKINPIEIIPTIDNSGSQWCSLIQQIQKNIHFSDPLWPCY